VEGRREGKEMEKIEKRFRGRRRKRGENGEGKDAA